VSGITQAVPQALQLAAALHEGLGSPSFQGGCSSTNAAPDLDTAAGAAAGAADGAYMGALSAAALAGSGTAAPGALGSSEVGGGLQDAIGLGQQQQPAQPAMAQAGDLTPLAATLSVTSQLHPLQQHGHNHQQQQQPALSTGQPAVHSALQQSPHLAPEHQQQQQGGPHYAGAGGAGAGGFGSAAAAAAGGGGAGGKSGRHHGSMMPPMSVGTTGSRAQQSGHYGEWLDTGRLT
jgi:hypothetical protein